jgi:hypothetical protein
MGALALTPSTGPTRAGVLSTPGAVAASDTISRTLLGNRGVTLEIINGNAASDTVTVSDASTTAEGAPAAPISTPVTNGTTFAFRILPQQADPVTGQVTITHSVTATVTYRMYPRD